MLWCCHVFCVLIKLVQILELLSSVTIMMIYDKTQFNQVVLRNFKNYFAGCDKAVQPFHCPPQVYVKSMIDCHGSIFAKFMASV